MAHSGIRGSQIAWTAVLALALFAAGCNCSDENLPDAGMLEDTGDPGIDAFVMEGCGDGRLDRATESCDDGNTADGDGCSANCQSDESCGNGVVDTAAGELCDDENTDDGDACRGDCGSDYSCGNGILDTLADGASEDEVCDDGNTVNADGCSAGCNSDESCGNSIVDLGAGEVCDDGNTDGDDDCSADCLTSLLCGNGVMDGVEECDDSNNDVGDGCNAVCQIERCGNGRVDFEEDCDDGDSDDTNGCTSGCDFTCAENTDCADVDVCNGAETCANPGSDTSACTAGTALSDGDSCGTDLICNGGSCLDVECGDGIVTAPEVCDDTNTTPGDGCENDCSFTCSADGDCDDSNACTGTETCSNAGTATSACVAGTALAEGASCGGVNICRAGACVSPGCGDGIPTGTEDCDDMNMTPGDGCENDCSWTCETGGDCDDGNPCTGTETCTGGGTLGSRCNAGTPLGDGDACGGGDICNGGSCVAPRCGDGIVTGTEDCDDMNMTNGDGCDACSWTCAGDGDCDDGNDCSGTETCTGASTLSSRCNAGTPPATGTLCDRGMSTRDICDMSTQSCVLSFCGDGYTDTGAMPAEQCDDGGSTSGDGCSATCQTEMAVPPTAFRITELRLISPRIVVNVVFSCQDITDNCPSFLGSCQADSINTMLATGLAPMSAGGDYTLNIVDVFRPLNIAAASSPTDLHLNPACMEGPNPDACEPDPTMPDLVSALANNTSVGNCYTPTPAEVNLRAGSPAMYGPPTVNTVDGPCFSSSVANLTISVGGIAIPLTDATVSATYDGSPTDALISGVVTGFLSETDATTVLLPATLPLVGGDPLYEHLQAGNRTVAGVRDACNVGGGTHEDDADMNGAVRGFRFFLNFEAEAVTWTDP